MMTNKRSAITTGKSAWFLSIFFVYILSVNFILPFLSVLRVMQIAEPGHIRNFMLPIFLSGFVLSTGCLRVAYPRTWLQIVLILLFFQATITGMLNIINEQSFRDWFSHLFQLASFYLMIGVGWCAAEIPAEKFWRQAAWISLIGVAGASVLIVVLMMTAGVGRFYTPAYCLLLPLSYFPGKSLAGTVASLFLVLSSNKRGVLIAVMIMFGAWFLVRKFFVTGSKRVFGRKSLICLLTLILLAGTTAYALLGKSGVQQLLETPLFSAMNITVKRTVNFSNKGTQANTLDQYSSSRLEELNLAMESMQWYSWFVGNGAGWSVVVNREGQRIHNVHFSPASLLLVYGLPFTIFIYLFYCNLLYKLYRNCSKFQGNTTAKVAFLYLIAALMHSLVAYSLFIDLFVPLFTGIALRLLKNQELARKLPVFNLSDTPAGWRKCP